MIILFFFLDLFLHLLLILLLDIDKIFLYFCDYLLSELLLLHHQSFLIDMYRRSFIYICRLHLIHCKLIIDVLQFHFFVSGL